MLPVTGPPPIRASPLSPLPTVSAEVFEGMVAGRNLLLLDDLLEQQNAELRGMIPAYAEASVRRLRSWLDTGRYRLDVAAASS